MLTHFYFDFRSTSYTHYGKAMKNPEIITVSTSLPNDQEGISIN